MEQTVVGTTESVQQAPITQPNVIPSIVPENVAAPAPVKDLITKVSEFKKSQTKPVVQNNENSFFDYKEIDKITDPIAKKFAEDAYKSMQSGFTKKTQEIAEQKRNFDQKMQEMQNWSTERIQRELNNPQFVQAAQAYAQVNNPQNSGLTDEQFSALTPQEKAEISGLKSQINALQQTNYQATVAQRDNQLQSRYPDYNPTQIDATIRDLAQMNPLDIREHVYKSLKHDEDVAAAYELGKSERDALNQTKINAITPNGNYTATSDGVPTREKGDTDQAYFQRIANFRLAQFKNRK